MLIRFSKTLPNNEKKLMITNNRKTLDKFIISQKILCTNIYTEKTKMEALILKSPFFIFNFDFCQNYLQM